MGGSDLLTTFTCNPKWIEIQDEVFEHQDPIVNHASLLGSFMRSKKYSFGSLRTERFFLLIAGLYVNSSLLNGRNEVCLPYTRIWCKNKVKATDIDKVICGEVPDPRDEKELFDIISHTDDPWAMWSSKPSVCPYERQGM